MSQPLDSPLDARLVLEHPVTGEVLIQHEAHRIRPGDTITISWTYPANGIPVEISHA